MAAYGLFIGADNTIKLVKPEGGKFHLPQLYALLKCSMVEQIVLVADSIDMIFDEEGKYTEKAVNLAATLLFWTLCNDKEDVIVGDVLVVGVENADWVGLFDLPEQEKKNE